MHKRNDDGSAPDDYQSGCTIVQPGGGIWRWSIPRNTWERIDA